MALRNWTEHESDLVFQDGGINWVCGALAPGCRGSAGPSPVGAYNSHADAARSWTCAECIDSRACRAAAHNYTRSVEVQRGRQRRPAQENPGLPRFERRLRWRPWTHRWGISRGWARRVWRTPRRCRKRRRTAENARPVHSGESDYAFNDG